MKMGKEHFFILHLNLQSRLQTFYKSTMLLFGNKFSVAVKCVFLSPENSGIFLQQWDAQVRPYIEMIDFMRRIGIERELALPAIAVVGDQSSGKSSVLEALSGVALPRGSGMSYTYNILYISYLHSSAYVRRHLNILMVHSGIVTRCPLELKLRKLSIGSDWTAIISYNDVRETFHDPAEVESYVRRGEVIYQAIIIYK